MRQIFKTHPWVPPKELPETQELFRKYGVPGSIRPGHLLKGKGEPSKLYLITRGAAAYYVADRYKSHPSVLSLLIPGCSACDLSVITGDRVNVTTRAIGPCEVLIMPPHVLTDLMKNNSYEVPISDTVWNRIPLDLTNEQYGAVVNLTRVSVSRIFSDWISKDLLYKSGRNVYVKAKLFENIYDWWTD